MKRSLIIILSILLTQCAVAQQNVCYVSLKGSDNNSGSINSPFATIYRAQQFIRDEIAKKNGNYQIILRGGVYELNKPITFDAKHDVNQGSAIEFKAYPNEKVTISGGKTLLGTWVKINNNGLWKFNLASTPGNTPLLQSLFANGKRLKRASSDTLFTNGPAPQFSKLYKFGVYDFTSIRKLIKDSLNAFCAFTYSGTDLDNLKDIATADVIVYNSWEASWQRIYKIDKVNKIIYFKNPSAYPVGFYNTRIRYVVENSLDYLTKPGEWYLDSRNNSILYYAENGENPNNVQFVVPVLDTLLAAKGNGKQNILISNIKFSDINFSYSKSAWGVNLNQQQYGYKALLETYKRTNSQLYPWLDFTQGFSGDQAALDCGAAISLESCEKWVFNNCTFTHLGNYAVGIANYSNNNIISNCLFSDIGGGGIFIAFNYLGGLNKNFPNNISPAGNQVLNCTITNCGVIFPSGVGIGIMQANHTLISHNMIYNLPYSGISVGWTFSSSQDNYTSYNTIEYNHIYNVLQSLTDGGGIYTLGKQVGTIYKGNYIYNITRNKNASGAASNGFFFDVGSSALKLDSNVVYNIKNDAVRYNQTDASKINIGYNYLQGMNRNEELRNVIFKKILK